MAPSIEKQIKPVATDSSGTLKKCYQEISNDQSLANVLDALPEAVIIVNQNRQVVFINQVSLNTFGFEEREMACGLRPGDVFSCNHATEAPGGCGTSKHCDYCGANMAIVSSLLEKTDIKECRITQRHTGIAVDLRVKAAPFEINGEMYTIVSILDVSDEKRREVLQRVFFHDILNTVGGLSGYSELLLMTEDEDAEEFKSIIYDLSQKLTDEIISQQQLVAAENGTLSISRVEVSSVDALNSTLQLCQQMQVAKGKLIKLAPESDDVQFKTDINLLSRVLGNLTKNALEASQKGEEVTIGCRQIHQTIEFYVHNQSVMPDAVKYQVFQRSFSTKGKGRGLGTYSIKLFTETYLKGSVRFVSDEPTGTTFYTSYPIEYP